MIHYPPALGLYVLDASGEPVQATTPRDWGLWYEAADRVVAADEVGDVLISTVFLGVDHSHVSGPPVLWETMAFVSRGEEFMTDLGNRFNTLDQRRYRSREEALRGHAEAVAEVHRLRAEGRLTR